MKRSTCLMIGCSLAVMLGCSTSRNDDKGDADPAAKGNNEFAFDLYRQLAKEAKGDENVFFSPYSISAALAMTYAGARGETAEQMAKVLRFDKNQRKFHPDFAAFTGRLTDAGKDGKGELLIANAVWVEQTVEVKKPFADLLDRHYGSGLKRVDFIGDPEGARKEVNDWGSEQTKKMIPEVLPDGSVDGDTRMVLANAVYFRDFWKIAFDPKWTQKKPFHVTPSTKVDAQLMHLEETKFRYAKAKDCQVVELPYTDGRFSMLVILPDSHDKMKTVEESLGKVGEWVAELHEQEVTLTLPRFTMEGRYEMKAVLKSMGMPIAFDRGRADFSGAASRRLFIDEVYHAAKIEADEAGTTAAAVTAVVMKGRSAKLVPTLTCDRPFLIMLRETSTGGILFMGRVSRPAK